MATLKGSLLEQDGEMKAVRNSNAEVMKEIKDLKENLSKVNKDVDKVKVMMSQMLEKYDMLDHELLSKLGSPTTEGIFNTGSRKENISIVGGRDAGHTDTEIFSWEKN
ncbi:Hypothetical predicted protein, partial [Paramuricea clavata]